MYKYPDKKGPSGVDPFIFGDVPIITHPAGDCQSVRPQVVVYMMNGSIIMGRNARSVVNKMAAKYWWFTTVRDYMVDVSDRCRAWDLEDQHVRVDTFEHFILDLETVGVLKILEGREVLEKRRK